MGSMIFAPQVLADALSETAGYKSGLALSIEDLCSHLEEDRSLILASEQNLVRLRSEEYESLFYRLLHRIGHTAEEYNGDFLGIGLYHKYKDTHSAEYRGVMQLFVTLWPKIMAEAQKKGAKKLDPRPFMHAAHDTFGDIGLTIAFEKLQALDQALRLNPHTGLRYVEWKSQLPLSDLFNGSNAQPESGRFIDQRFIDYLHNNEERLPEMHWRKFEELTAEFFHREGFRVELGPGSNDDGVDVRVWKSDGGETENPHFIVQCKRQKAKIEKVVVKGLHADVLHEGAEFGLVVTTSALSPGARTVISNRGYPIQEIDRGGLSRWLQRLRTPGTGIVRL